MRGLEEVQVSLPREVLASTGSNDANLPLSWEVIMVDSISEGDADEGSILKCYNSQSYFIVYPVTDIGHTSFMMGKILYRR